MPRIPHTFFILPPPMKRIQIDEVDMQILDCYKENPRASAAAVGAEVDYSETAVRERTKKLVDSGVLSFEVSIDYDRISSYSLQAYVEVVFPGEADVHLELQELVSRIRAHKSVVGTKTRIIAGSWWHGANKDRAAG